MAWPNSSADIGFYIDGTSSGMRFVATPSGEPGYSYYVLLYANDSLEYGSHVIKLQNGRIGGDISLVLLDYITYST